MDFYKAACLVFDDDLNSGSWLSELVLWCFLMVLAVFQPLILSLIFERNRQSMAGEKKTAKSYTPKAIML